MTTAHPMPAPRPVFETASRVLPSGRSRGTDGRARPELFVFAALLIVLNAPLLTGSVWRAMILDPQAVLEGEWWRLLTHAFVHATWYHLLLDGAAFLLLYQSLSEWRLPRRLACVFGGGIGSAVVSWWATPAIWAGGLCGLSGIAHALMAVSAVEMIANPTADPAQRRLGWISFLVVVAKAALEAWSGRMLFTFLHLGLMGDPVAVSHAGGVIGGLVVMLLLGHSRHRPPEKSVTDESAKCAVATGFLAGEPLSPPATVPRTASRNESRAGW